jgi:hypothetical protein
MKSMRRMFCGLMAMLTLSAVRAQTERPDLHGRVTLEDETPVTNATVFIYTAGPKQGTSILCPSCYVDCNKKARTDAEGRFQIESLDPTLKFRLLVVAPGFETRFVEGVDPASGPQRISLKLLDPDVLSSPTRIAGMVVDEEGKPVVGAVIGPEGVQRGTSTHWGGTDRFVDPLSVAGDEGRFLLLCKEDVQAVHAVVEGPGVAKRWVELKPGRDHLIRMTEGVTVTGLIERDGRPMTNVVVGLVTSERRCGEFMRCDGLATDQEGRFLIPNVPPEREFVLYAKMDSLTGRGTLPTKTFRTGKSGTTSKIGALTAEPGFRLAGRVVLSDGNAIPAGTRMYFGREQAWDPLDIELGPEGRFELTDIPAESVSFGVRIKGYKFSKGNPNLDWLNGGLVGRVDGDITDLTLLMEPGEWRYNGEEGEPPDGVSQPRERPLRGTER